MPLSLSDRLTEFLDRAQHVYGWPVHPPPETSSPGCLRSRKAADWMEAERRLDEWWHPDRVRVTPDPLVRLAAARKRVLDLRLAYLEAHGRTPCVCLYVLAPLRGRPVSSFAAVRTYADGNGWRVGADGCVTDRLSTTDPMCRPGWRWVLRMIRAGHADGVVVLTHTAISRRLDEYEISFDLMDLHGGFVALMTRETARTKR
jgi:hypothetical protein